MNNQQLNQHFSLLVNMRELGGVPVNDGRTVKHGLFYRSASPYYMSQKEMKALKKLNLKFMIDLRGSAEALSQYYEPVKGVEYINFPVFGSDSKKDYASLDDLRRRIHEVQINKEYDFYDFYTGMIPHKDAFQFIFDRMLEEEVPFLCHCTAGKDRTGMAAMLMLLAFGASEDDIIVEYALTNTYRRQAILEDLSFFEKDENGQSINHEYIVALNGVNNRAAQAVLDIIRQVYGGREKFLYEEYGLDSEKLKRLRDLYLE